MSDRDAEELIEERMGEDKHERRARELIELLQELRVVLPGVQVLFAFLLTVPFSARFENVSPLQQTVFFATLVCTAISAALLIAPSVHHRVLWRQQAREHRLRVANRLAIAGVVLLVPGMVGAIFVITDILFGSTAAAVGTAVITAFFIYVWFVMPIWYRLSGR
jgi:predicted neutral ceramidase superfamily lipid hydrolase